MARALRIQRENTWYHVMSRRSGDARLFEDDGDRVAFLRMLSEVPERFRLEVHAFVLMGNHYHLLVRTRLPNLGAAVKWLNVSYTTRFNWAHAHRGHVLQGRYRSVVILDESRLAAVARYIHLNPVRIAALGLDKPDRARARLGAVRDPGPDLVARRLRCLAGHRWSSWPAYAGTRRPDPWLTTSTLAGDVGGFGERSRTAALRAYTEAPLHEGRMQCPWDDAVAGMVLGDEAEALALLRGAGGERSQQTAARRAGGAGRPSWRAIVAAAEAGLGCPWDAFAGRRGHWGRDAVLAAANRRLGWPLADVVREIPGLGYNAAARAVARFMSRMTAGDARHRFVEALVRQLSNV